MVLKISFCHYSALQVITVARLFIGIINPFLLHILNHFTSFIFGTDFVPIDVTVSRSNTVIQISELTNIISADPNVLQDIENVEENLDLEIPFDGMIEAFLADAAVPQSKMDLKIAIEGQAVAEEEIPVEDIPVDMAVLEQKDGKLPEDKAIILNDVAIKIIKPDSPHPVVQTQIPQVTQATPQPQPTQDVVQVQASTQAIHVTKETKITDVKLDVIPESNTQTKTEAEPELSQIKIAENQSKVDKEVTKEVAKDAAQLKQIHQDAMLHDKPVAKTNHVAQIIDESQQKVKQDTTKATDLTTRIDVTSQTRPTGTPQTPTQPTQFQAALNQEIQVPVNHENWSKAFNEKLVMMAGKGIDKALIQIDPVELGPIEVSINVDGDGTSLHFTTLHHNIKDLIESQINQLRQDFSQSGIELIDVSVNQQDERQNFAQHDSKPQESGEVQIENKRQDSDGLLDVYV